MNKKRFKNMLPRYGIVLVGAVIAFNCLVYYSSKAITTNLVHHDIATALDNAIPLCTPFITIYIIAYIEWVIGYIFIAQDSKSICYKYLGGELIAKAICLIIFIAFPTAMARPELTGSGFFDWITGIVYYYDQPTCLFPSIHVLETYLIARASCEMKKVTKGYKIFTWVFLISVCLSVVLVKQHLLLDIPAAVIAAEVGICVSKKLLLKGGKITKQPGGQKNNL